jgi:magnesium transporter
MLDIYLSGISTRMNKIMTVLAVISTIFMPLTFLAGVYGMNFQHMPELGWKYGYPLVLTVMVFSGTSMILYFKKKKWL